MTIRLIKTTNLFLRLIATLSLTLTISCINDNEDNGTKGDEVKIGDSLPKFEVSLNDGRKISTESLRGKISILVFFNTKCSDCQKELPEVQKVYDSYQTQPDSQRPAIVCIARSENADEIEKYWATHSLSLPYSAQPDAKVYKLFADRGIPRVYISDAKLKVRTIFNDTDYPTPEMLTQAIEDCR